MTCFVSERCSLRKLSLGAPPGPGCGVPSGPRELLAVRATRFRVYGFARTKAGTTTRKHSCACKHPACHTVGSESGLDGGSTCSVKHRHIFDRSGNLDASSNFFISICMLLCLMLGLSCAVTQRGNDLSVENSMKSLPRSRQLASASARALALAHLEQPPDVLLLLLTLKARTCTIDGTRGPVSRWGDSLPVISCAP